MPSVTSSLSPGKLPAPLLASLLDEHIVVDDPAVLVAPAPGFDAAVVRPEADIIVKCDPITFATSHPAAYLLAVNANDIACLGGEPRWIAVTALFPVGTSADDVRHVFTSLATEATRIHVTLIAGHTEITSSVNQLVLSGTMLGTPGPQGTLVPGGASAGDTIWLTQAAGIEGTSIIATEAPESLLANVPEWTVTVARELLNDPGISIVESARLARGNADVTAMHDPTEGGVATALHELADASSLGIQVDLDAIPVWPVTRDLTELFDISPLGLIASGALLFTTRGDDTSRLESAFAEADIPLTRIGTMLANPNDRIARAGTSTGVLPRYDADEITRVFARLDAN